MTPSSSMILAVCGWGWGVAWGAEPLSMPADLYRPAPGAVDALVTAPLRAPVGFSASADLSWGRRLLTHQLGSLPPEVLLRDAVSVQVAAAWGQPRWDVGLSLPTYAHLAGTAFPEGGAGALGDPGVQGRLGLTPWLSALAGATLPLGDTARMTGYGQATGQLGLIAGGEHLRAALGYLLAPTVNIGNNPADDRLHLSIRGGLDLSPRWSLSAEAWTTASYRDIERTSLPGELLISSHHRLSGGAGLLRMGVGTAILPGVGVPAARLVVGMGQSPAPAPAPASAVSQ